MQTPELEVVRFGSEDVIATSQFYGTFFNREVSLITKASEAQESRGNDDSYSGEWVEVSYRNGNAFDPSNTNFQYSTEQLIEGGDRDYVGQESYYVWFRPDGDGHGTWLTDGKTWLEHFTSNYWPVV